MTKHANEEDFVKIKLKQRGMANMTYFKGTDTTILGHKVAMPIGLGAIPEQQKFSYDGEVASAQAAKELGLVITLDASRSSKPLDEVLSESAGGLKMLRLNLSMSAESIQ